MKSTIIEKESIEGAYGMSCEMMVVSHPKHGRLLLIEGFGGVDSPAGGQYRYRHGKAIKLQESDTLESLRGGEWNDHCSLLEAVIQGYDNSRPVMTVDGHMITSMAKATE